MLEDLPLHEACDAYDALFGPSSEAHIETATVDAVIAIDDTDSTIPAAIELAVGAMDSCVGGIGDMTNSVQGAIVGGAIAVDGAMGTLTAGAMDAVDVAIAGDVITEAPTINRFNKSRPFYGPNINSDTAFISSGGGPNSYG